MNRNPNLTRAITSFAAALLVCAWGSAVSAQKREAPIEAPFEFLHDQVVVQVMIGDKGPFTMLLDTDTNPSAIDQKTAQELGLVAGSKGSTATGGGMEKNTTYPARIPSLDLGSLRARDLSAATIDLAKLSEKLGRPVHGVLGYSFLKDRIVQIDYPKMKVRFFSTSPYPSIQLTPNTVNRVALPFRLDDGLVVIDAVYVNGQKLVATLDTGSSGTFSLTPQAVTLLGLEEEAKDGEAKESVGYNGRYEVHEGILKSVRIGRLGMDEMPATFWPAGSGHDQKSYLVNIGNGFFRDFIMTFDYRSKVVVFEKVE